MDTTAKNKVDIKGKLETIKRHMPTVYSIVNARAEQFGNQVFADVRAGLRGEPDKFYAFEGLYVVGTRFSDPAIHDDVLNIEPKPHAGAFWFEPKPATASACSQPAEVV